MRWIAYAAGVLLAIVIVAGAGLFLLLDRFDLGGFAAAQASAALGRGVSIAALHVRPGAWVAVELKDLRVANLPGGSRPDMVRLGRLTAEVSLASLLRGPPVIRHARIDGLSVVLERVGGQARNWRFGERAGKARGDGRAGFPTLLDAHVSGSEITFRTSVGTALQTRIDDGSVATASADAPVSLKVSGAYHDVPVTLEAALQPIAALRREGTPYGADIRMTSGETRLQFQGTMTDPLDVDGVAGTLSLVAPALDVILGAAGMPAGAVRGSVELTGELAHADPDWALTNATGRLDDSPLAPSALRFRDGGSGRPDEVALDLVFDRLNLDALLAGLGGGSGGPMGVEAAPDPEVRLHLSAARLAYAGNEATGVSVTGGVGPGAVTLEELAATVLGAKLRATGRAEAAGGGVRVSAEGEMAGADLQQLRRVTGGSPVPMTGALSARATADGAGASIGEAARAAHVAAVAWMTSGSLSRDLIEKASLNVLRLFRKPRGMSPVSCLLAVVDIRNGLGTLSPIRIRAADGTIAGQGTFDLRRNQVDLTVGTSRSTTGAFALDVPIRVQGNIDNPTVLPSTRSVRLATANLGALPPDLRAVATGNACLR